MHDWMPILSTVCVDTPRELSIDMIFRVNICIVFNYNRDHTVTITATATTTHTTTMAGIYQNLIIFLQLYYNSAYGTQHTLNENVLLTLLSVFSIFFLLLCLQQLLPFHILFIQLMYSLRYNREGRALRWLAIRLDVWVLVSTYLHLASGDTIQAICSNCVHSHLNDEERADLALAL